MPDPACSICGQPGKHHASSQCIVALKEENAALESCIEEAERRIAELQSEVACEERRFNAQYDLLAEVSKRADALEPRLRDAERRSAGMAKALSRLADDGCGFHAELCGHCVASDALASLPARTAAVLAVLDAARTESRKHGAGGCNCLHGCGCVCGCELCKAIRNLDKE